MPLNLNIVTGNPAPIYKQIADQVRRAVGTRGLMEGEQMPSVRALAERLVINPNTVARAYAELSRDGILDSQAGRGFFVAKKRRVFSDAERGRRFEMALEGFVSEALFLDFSEKEIVEGVRREIGNFQTEARQKS
ncbi:MAG TPA: GntR family transcriptional regulator [Chthoniobacteraceae bacterium]|nr:GntR family transcriptional regulator [Chthoniobacteraceae bacterium]